MNLERASVTFSVFIAIIFAGSFLTSDAHGVLQRHGSRPAKKAPRVFTMDGEALADLKDAIRKNPSAFEVPLELLRKEASAYLDLEPWTITSKTVMPPSGNSHDYESQGPYWWPNPDSRDGLPYIRRDGEKNPEIEKLTDHKSMSAMTQAVKTLSLAYYLTGDDQYARKATAFLRAWFINAETRMNPHLKYGQRIPGITEGRGIGIIETRFMGDVTDAVGLLESSPGWTRLDQNGMLTWMGQYLDWLLTSEHGKDEAKQHNNHGTWYDVQVAALALFVDRKDVARQTILRTLEERLPKHIEPDGRQPHELARTRSWSYSVMNLQSFFTLATLAGKVDINLWKHSTPDGRSLRRALDFLAQFADPGKPRTWEYKQIGSWSTAQLTPLLYQAACAYPDGNYSGLARNLEGDNASLNKLLFYCSVK